MVLPHAVNLETASGQPLRHKVQLFHNADALFIAGHNIAFYAVKLQNIPGETDNLCYSLGGIAFALTVSRDFIGEITAFYTAEKNVGDAYRADDAVIALFA